MKRALSLASHGVGHTRSNPLVGAVIVDTFGVVVGEGFHRRLGGDHAEIEALSAAGERARGGTLILNLEPCCHTGRTGPCTRAIIDAGISRVVIAHRDPDPRVSGRGVAALTDADIELVEGVERVAAEQLNEVYLLFKRLGRPFITVKLALTLDGFTGDEEGHSRWITGPACRRHAHALRARHDAILVGARTARADDPELDVRDAEGPSPQRFVLVGREEVPLQLRMFAGERPALRVGTEAARSDWVVDADADGLPAVKPFLQELVVNDYASLLVEGGPRIAGLFMRQQLVDRIVLYYGPLMIGRGRPALHQFVADLTGAVRLETHTVESLADGFVVAGRPEFK